MPFKISTIHLTLPQQKDKMQSPVSTEKFMALRWSADPKTIENARILKRKPLKTMNLPTYIKKLIWTGPYRPTKITAEGS